MIQAQKERKRSNTSDDIRIAALMDLHIGHPKTIPSKTHEHLEKYLYPELKNIDLLLIGGDFFDNLLNLNSDAGMYAGIIIDDLIEFAKEYKFFIRVIRGTFTHDRYQNRFFLVKDGGENNIDGCPLVRVIDNIELEYISSLNLSIIYCPDDQPYKDLTGSIINIISKHPSGKVDILCSHGYYDHMLPSQTIHIPHNTLYWDRLKSYISGIALNGHIHNSFVYNNVISVGSFERMKHADEGPKGYYLVNYNTKKKKATYKQVVNELATPFITIPLNNFGTPEKVCQYITTLVDEKTELLGKDARIFIRLLGNSPDVKAFTEELFPNVTVSMSDTSFNDEPDEDLNISCDELPVITEDNLPDLILSNISKDIKITVKEIKEILNE